MSVSNRRSLRSPAHGSVIGIEVVAGQAVAAGQTLLLIESMKMELPVEAPAAGRVLALHAAVGDVVELEQPLVELGGVVAPAAQATAHDLDTPRTDLRHVLERHVQTQDAARADAIAKRHAQCLRSARENVAELLDAGSFVEYGALAVAAQRSRRSIDDLQANAEAAAAGRAMSTGRSSPGSIARPLRAGPRCRARCRGWASSPAAASPATRRCSVAAT